MYVDWWWIVLVLFLWMATGAQSRDYRLKQELYEERMNDPAFRTSLMKTELYIAYLEELSHDHTFFPEQVVKTDRRYQKIFDMLEIGDVGLLEREEMPRDLLARWDALPRIESE